MIDMCVATYCLGVMRKLEKQTTVMSMETKLYPIVREFLLLKSKHLRSLKFVKVEAHKDDIKSFE